MPTFSFDEFVPTGYLVRTESRKLLYCAELDWETGYGEQMCSTYREADAFLRNAYENWLKVVCSQYGKDNLWIKTRDCHYGEWQIEVYAAKEFHPRKFAVDGQIYVRFSPKDPAERDEWGETNHWMILDLRILMEIEAFYGLDFVADTEPEPEPEEEIFDAAMVVIERLGLGAEPEPETPVWYTEPEPEPEQYQPEDLMIPIPSWDWIDTSVETEPEPDRVAYASVWVSIETPQWSVDGSASFDLPNNAAEAATEIDDLSSRILWRLEDTIGSAPESNQRSSSEFWGKPEDNCPWISQTSVWDLGQRQLCRVTLDWEISVNQSPRSPMIAEAIIGIGEPLWLGAIRKDGKVAVFADRYPQTIANWAKGALDLFSVEGQVYISGLHEVESARKGNQPRGFYAWSGSFSAEGIRLI